MSDPQTSGVREARPTGRATPAELLAELRELADDRRYMQVSYQRAISEARAAGLSAAAIADACGTTRQNIYKLLTHPGHAAAKPAAHS